MANDVKPCGPINHMECMLNVGYQDSFQEVH